ncbi:unnamed protein product [Caenorhabditis brenneri]
MKFAESLETKNECLAVITCLANLDCSEYERQKLVEIADEACERPPTKDYKCQNVLEELQKSVEYSEDARSHLELCGELKNCLAQNPTNFSPSQLETIYRSCDLIEFQIDPLTRCFQKLKLHNTQMKAACLHDHNVFDFSKSAVCGYEQQELQCMLGVIQEECGPEAAKSYEVHQAVLVEIYNC